MHRYFLINLRKHCLLYLKHLTSNFTLVFCSQICCYCWHLINPSPPLGLLGNLSGGFWPRNEDLTFWFNSYPKWVMRSYCPKLCGQFVNINCCDICEEDLHISLFKNLWKNEDFRIALCTAQNPSTIMHSSQQVEKGLSWNPHSTRA